MFGKAWPCRGGEKEFSRETASAVRGIADDPRRHKMSFCSRLSAILGQRPPDAVVSVHLRLSGAGRATLMKDRNLRDTSFV